MTRGSNRSTQLKYEPAVEELQRLLFLLGYNRSLLPGGAPNIDGLRGPMTQRAETGLSRVAVGSGDLLARARMEFNARQSEFLARAGELAGRVAAGQALSQAEAVELQVTLAQVGDLKGRIDGVVGPLTIAASSTFLTHSPSPLALGAPPRAAPPATADASSAGQARRDIHPDGVALTAFAERYGLDWRDMMGVIGRETGKVSGGRVVSIGDPDTWGGYGGRYLGLIQFSPENQRHYGVRPGMSFSDQLNGPVARYLEDRFRQANMPLEGAKLVNIYAAILAGDPRKIGSADINGSAQTAIKKGEFEVWGRRLAASYGLAGEFDQRLSTATMRSRLVAPESAAIEGGGHAAASGDMAGRLAIVGDSIAFGVDPAHAEVGRTLLAPWKGADGSLTTKLEATTSGPPATIAIVDGHNLFNRSTGTGANPNDVRERLTAIVSRMQEQGHRPILVEPMQVAPSGTAWSRAYSAHLEQMQQVFRQVAASRNVPLVETNGVTAFERSGDGLHLTRRGYAALGAAIQKTAKRDEARRLTPPPSTGTVSAEAGDQQVFAELLVRYGIAVPNGRDGREPDGPAASQPSLAILEGDAIEIERPRVRDARPREEGPMIA